MHHAVNCWGNAGKTQKVAAIGGYNGVRSGSDMRYDDDELWSSVGCEGPAGPVPKRRGYLGNPDCLCEDGIKMTKKILPVWPNSQPTRTLCLHNPANFRLAIWDKIVYR